MVTSMTMRVVDRKPTSPPSKPKPLSIYWVKTVRNWSMTPVSFMAAGPFHGKIGGAQLPRPHRIPTPARSEEHTSELQSLMRISYAVFCLKKKKNNTRTQHTIQSTAKANTDTKP